MVCFTLYVNCQRKTRAKLSVIAEGGLTARFDTLRSATGASPMRRRVSQGFPGPLVGHGNIPPYRLGLGEPQSFLVCHRLWQLSLKVAEIPRSHFLRRLSQKAVC